MERAQRRKEPLHVALSGMAGVDDTIADKIKSLCYSQAYAVKFRQATKCHDSAYLLFRVIFLTSI
jgi:hypothetical protein